MKLMTNDHRVMTVSSNGACVTYIGGGNGCYRVLPGVKVFMRVVVIVERKIHVCFV